jgi:Immunoglobulin domain/Immunoglobulin I-set domain
MKRLIHSLRSPIARILVGLAAMALVGYFVVTPQSAATVNTFTVTSTLDLPDLSPGDGVCNADNLLPATCTLRAAIMESDFLGGDNVINVPAGTYTLTLGPADDEPNAAGATMESGDLDIVDLSAFALPTLTSVTINGAGAGSTIIDGGAMDRVIDVNNFAASGQAVNVTLSGLTIRNGNAPNSGGYNEAGGGIQFDGFDNQTFSPAGTLTITNCAISNNLAAGQGGGILAIFGSLNMSGSQVSGNTSTNGAGGGVSYDGSSFSGLRTLQITNSSFSTNHANNGTFGRGGGMWLGGNATKTVTHNGITSNTAGAQGGGAYNSSGSLTLNYNVVVGNTASASPGSSGFHNNSGPVDANNNWWGCNAGPSFSPCNRANNATGIPSWLKLSHTATPNTITTGQSTTLQADFFTNNLGTGIAPSDLVALNGRAVTFNNAVLGNISNADATINGGKANATYNAGNTGGNGSADATVDSATVTASILIGEPAGVGTNPTDQTVCEGQTATFTASGTGSPAPTVQWQVSTDNGANFNDISGATSTTLSFTATASQNGNQYRAVFTNAGGSATTSAATLTVNTAPTVTTNPSSTTVCEGQPVSFTAAANGSPTPTVQWQVSSGGGPFSNIPGETSTTLSFTATNADNGKQYQAVFTNSCSSATTTAATLTVDSNVTASDPADQTVCQGATASFSTTASGSGLSLQWKLDGTNISGATGSSVNIDTTSLPSGTHTVEVVATGTCNTVTQSANLYVNAPTTTTDPADATVCAGGTANFSTTAGGTGPFSYAWKVDGLPYASNDSGNSSSISVNTTGYTPGAHSVEVKTTGACGTATQTATLTVSNTPPSITAATSDISVWPPNHQYQTFTAADFGITASSGCDGDLTNSVVIASVSSDEPEDNLAGADGTTLNDIVIAANCKSVDLRRERDGDLNGRVYTITFKVTDSVGQTSTVTVTVSVPLNNNGSPAVNNGPAGGYTVNSLCP